jgi:hypothetical protein
VQLNAHNADTRDEPAPPNVPRATGQTRHLTATAACELPGFDLHPQSKPKPGVRLQKTKTKEK